MNIHLEFCDLYHAYRWMGGWVVRDFIMYCTEV